MKRASVNIKSVSNFSKLIAGLAFVQLVNFLFSLILPIYISAVEFAEFGIFISIVFILSEIINAKLDIAVMLGKTVEIAEKIAISAIHVAVLGSLFAFLITASFLFFIPKMYALIPFVLLMYGIHQPILVLLNKQEKYGDINVFRILQVLFTASTTLVLAQQKINHALIIGFTFGILIATIYSCRFIVFKFDLEQLKKNWKTYDQFPKFGTWSSLVNNISRNSVPIVLAAFFSAQWVGLYSYATRLLNAPTGMYSNALSLIFFKNASELNNTALKSNVKKISFITFAIGIIPTFIFLFLGESIFQFLFGNEWKEAGKIAQYLILWYFSGLLASPISSILDIKFKLKFEFKYNIVLLVCRISALLIGGFFGQFYTSILLFSIVGIVFNLYLFFYIQVHVLNDDSTKIRA